MTNKIEKQFFDTFGIKPVPIYSEFWHIRDKYPQITDHILLKLICILTCWHLDEREPYETTSINREQLKNQVLSDIICIAGCETTKYQVQKIFEVR